MGDVRVAEAEHEAFGCAAGFQELRKLDLDNAVAVECQARFKLGTDVVEQDGAADIDGVAGEAKGVGFGDGDTRCSAEMILDAAE